MYSGAERVRLNVGISYLAPMASGSVIASRSVAERECADPWADSGLQIEFPWNQDLVVSVGQEGRQRHSRPSAETERSLPS